MTDKLYAITKVDGTVAVMRLLNNTPVEDALAKWTDEARSQVVSATEISEDVIPKDRTFRNCWKFGTSKISVSIPRARKQKLQELRHRRDKKLKDLDIDSMKAFGTQDVVLAAATETKKQILRDLPDTMVQELDSLKSVRALKTYLPVELL